jgi:hypothetical protein
MATRIVGITQESQRVEIRAFMRRYDPVCETNSSDCCVEATGTTVTTPCCPETAPAELAITAIGPIGTDGTECEFDFTLTVDQEQPTAWSGQQNGECASLYAKVWCVVVDEITYWTIAGEWRTPGGDLHRFETELAVDVDTLIADVPVDGGGTLSIAVEWPCAPPPSTDCCPDTSMALHFVATAETGDCECAIGNEFTLDYDSGYGGWQTGGSPITVCDYTLDFAIQCTGDGVYTSSIGGNAATFTVTDCDPFTATIVGTVTTVPPDLLCTGTITWTVTQVPPTSPPPPPPRYSTFG